MTPKRKRRVKSAPEPRCIPVPVASLFHRNSETLEDLVALDDFVVTSDVMERCAAQMEHKETIIVLPRFVATLPSPEDATLTIAEHLLLLGEGKYTVEVTSRFHLWLVRG